MQRPANASSILSLARTCATVLVVTSLFISGCDSAELQQQLDDKKTSRFKAAAEAVAAIEAARLKALGPLPAANTPPVGNKPAIVSWRAAIFTVPDTAPEGAAPAVERDDVAVLEKLMNDRKLGKGTPAEEAARYGVGFAGSSRAYWAGKGNLERYSKFLDGYVREAAKMAAAASAEGNIEFVQRPFLAEAEFDRLFIFASRQFVIAQLPVNARLLATYGSWQIAFNLPSRGRERFSEYVTRVCRVGKLAKNCAGVPHEMRPLAINKPYLEWQKVRAEAIVASKPHQAFGDFAKSYIAMLDEQLKATPDFSEDPVLPSTYADRAASAGLMLSMGTKRGVMLHTTEVSDSFSGKVPKGLSKAGGEVIQVLKDTPGNQVDFERVVLEMPGEVGGNQLLTAIRAFPRDIVRQFDLIGRRRADESLRRTGVMLRLQAKDQPDTASYQLHGDSRKTMCQYIGIAGKPDIGRRAAGSYLIWSKDRIRAAKLDWDDPTSDKKRPVAQEKLSLDIAPTDTAKLDAWLDANPGRVRMFISGGQSYDKVLQAISGVTHKCHDLEVAIDDYGREKKVFRCGNSDERDVTVPISICK